MKRTVQASGFVEAAGGLIVNQNARIAVVHRGTHDDWSFPKGHLEADETHREAALREVLEETGFHCKITRRLGDSEYTNRFGLPKRVRYYAMADPGTPFVPNDEVDDLKWVDYHELSTLTYQLDIELARRHWAAITNPS